MTAPRVGGIARLTIDSLGARGDGVGRIEGKPVYVPYTLPGESLQGRIVQSRGDGLVAVAQAIEAASPNRIAPACRHFGLCGGCAVQHMERDAYLAWKSGLVVQAMARRGFAELPIGAMVATPAGRRRRATLAAMRARKGAILGFHERASHRLVDIDECPVLLPHLAALLAPLRNLMCEVLAVGQSAQIVLNDADNGVDCQISAESAPDLAGRETLAAFAERHDLARIAWRTGDQAEPVAERRAPVLRLGDIAVSLPPAAFLQASREGESALQGFVREWLEESESVIDLFGGVGTLSLGLLPDKRVLLVEGDREAARAVERAARLPAARGRLACLQRNLSSEPVAVAQLDGFAAAIVDPPRGGAAAQARELAASQVPVVVSVSCDPASFARDARILVDGGYVLERLVPVDQFLWSPHVELVALFRRKRV